MSSSSELSEWLLLPDEAILNEESETLQQKQNVSANLIDLALNLAAFVNHSIKYILSIKTLSFDGHSEYRGPGFMWYPIFYELELNIQQDDFSQFQHFFHFFLFSLCLSCT